MSSNQANQRLDRAVAAIPSCALDEVGLREQRARYARLAAFVTEIEQEREAVTIEFRGDFDRDALDEALAVERACCPFFRFRLDEPRRRLSVTVREREQLPALDAIAQALGAAAPVSDRPAPIPGSR